MVNPKSSSSGSIFRVCGGTAVRVYPRVCGGTGLCQTASIPAAVSPRTGDLVRSSGVATGLSPRVRGNLATMREENRRKRVYPRVCGGTPLPLPQPLPCSGSIPACAGEPRRGEPQIFLIGVYPRVCGGTAGGSNPSTRWQPGVYPRVCGGTGLCQTASIPASGLSPRVRGNLSALVYPSGVAGRRVYPRVCGGTHRQAPVGLE